MAWIRNKKFTFKKGLFTVNYDTAHEFGVAAAEIWHYHGELIENQYDPDTIDFDEFNDAKMSRRDSLLKGLNK